MESISDLIAHISVILAHFAHIRLVIMCRRTPRWFGRSTVRCIHFVSHVRPSKLIHHIRSHQSTDFGRYTILVLQYILIIVWCEAFFVASFARLVVMVEFLR